MANNTAHLIGVIYNNNQVVGYRIIEYPTGRTSDFIVSKVLAVLKSKANDDKVIHGMMYSSAEDKIVATNGSFDRYGKIIGETIKDNAIVILYEIGDVGYAVASAKGGTIKKYRKADVIKLAATTQIANGSVVKPTNPGGTEFIRSISGGYPTEQVNKPNQQNSTQTPTSVQTQTPAQVSVKSAQPPQEIQDKPKEVPVDTRAKLDEALKRFENKLSKLDDSGNYKTDTDEFKEILYKFDTLGPNETAQEAFQIKDDSYEEGAIDLFNLDKYRDRVDKRVGIEQERIHGNKVSWNESKLRTLRNLTGEYTLEELLGAVRMSFKNYKPFFYAALQVVPLIESTEVDTLGASTDAIYYNADFTMKLALPEAVFILWHELAHILMKHQSRRGTRDPYLWNIACDLYINKYICDEAGIAPTSGPKVIRHAASNKIIAQIAFPQDQEEKKPMGLYSALVDIKEDTPESIYGEMLDSFKNQQQQNQQGGQPNGLPGQQGQSGQGGQSQQGQQNQGGSQGQLGSPGQSGNQQGNQQGNGTQSGAQQGAQGAQQGNQQGQGQSQGGSPGQSGSQSGQGGQPGGQGNQPGQQDNRIISKISIQDNGDGTKTVKITMNDGTEITANTSKDANDMVKDDNSVKDSGSTADDRVHKVLAKTQTIYKKILESSSDCGSGAGGCDVCQAYVEDELVPRVNWRTLVQSRLRKIKVDEKSISTPDRRFIQDNLYVPGERFDHEFLPGVRVCVDTSGSMSDIDIAIAIAQIAQLCKQYKVDADLVYWDDGIQGIIPFKDLKELNIAKYRAMGRGGTNVECVFEEFSKREYRLGLKGKTQTSLIIIFTDGYFGMPSEKYRRYFGRNTVWVLCSTNSNRSFDPPFGTIAKLTPR